MRSTFISNQMRRRVTASSTSSDIETKSGLWASVPSSRNHALPSFERIAWYSSAIVWSASSDAIATPLSWFSIAFRATSASCSTPRMASSLRCSTESRRREPIARTVCSWMLWTMFTGLRKSNTYAKYGSRMSSETASITSVTRMPQYGTKPTPLAFAFSPSGTNTHCTVVSTKKLITMRLIGSRTKSSVTRCV